MAFQPWCSSYTFQRPFIAFCFVAAMSRPLTDEDFQAMMSCSQVPGRGWLGASYAIFNQLERVEKEEKEKEEQEKKDEQKDDVIDLEEGKTTFDLEKEVGKNDLDKGKEKVNDSQSARGRSRSPKKHAVDSQVANESQ